MPRKKKRRRARVNIGRDEHGNIIYKWAGAYSKRELEAEKARIRAEYAGIGKTTPLPVETPQRPNTPPCATFQEYAGNWYALYKKADLRQSSQAMYENVLDKHLYPAIGSIAINAIEADTLQRLLITYVDKSKSIIDKVMMVLRQVFAAALADGIIQRDPVQRLKPPQGTVNERMPVPYENVKELTAALIAHPDGALPLLMMYSGLRRGEALGLMWADIDGGNINVSRQAVMQGNTTIIGDTKTHAAHRTVPIPRIVLDKLGAPGGGYVFGGGKLYTQSKVKRMFERLARDIPAMVGVTPHRLRHTYTMLLRRAGVDPATAQYLLGHEDYETTANTYTHIDTMDIATAQTQMQTLFCEMVPAAAVK